MQRPPLTATQERFLAYHRAANHSPKLLSHYETTFRDFARFLAATNRPADLSVLSSATMEAFIAHLKETPLDRPYRGTRDRAIMGIHGHLRDLKAFVRWCQDEELIDWRVKVTLPKLPKRLYPILSDEELARLFNNPLTVGSNEYAVRNRALLALLLDTGIRLGELAGLTPRDILQGQYVRVIGKGDKERVVPFQAEAKRLLSDWLKVRAALDEPEDAPLFRLNRHGIVSLVRRLKRAAGVDVYPHKVRHTCATKLVRNRVDISHVKEILGHSSIVVTEGYLSLSREDLRDKHAEGSPFASIAGLLPDQPPKKPTRRRLRQG